MPGVEPEIDGRSGRGGDDLIAQAQLILRASELKKRYGGTLALDSAGVSVVAGEVHGLLGQNGSGKSTLIKVLAGVVTPEEGELEIMGERLQFPLAIGESHRRGLRFVHQNLGLIPSLSVAENLFIERLSLSRRNVFINWRSFFDEAGSTDKQLKLYDDYAHDLLNDQGKEQVMADVTEWITTRIPAR